MTAEHREGRDWAVALVHGIGHTEPVEMLKLVTDAVGTQRRMQLEPDVRVFLPADEQPRVAQLPSNTPEPLDSVRQHVRHGRIGNTHIRVATAYWSDVSMFGEGLIRLIGNMALGGMGVRYLADAGSGAKSLVMRALHAVLTLKIVLLALGFLPIVLCTLFFSLSTLIGYYLFRKETFFLQAWAIPLLALAAIWMLAGLARRMLWHMRGERSLALPIFNAFRIYGVMMAAVMLIGHRRALGAYLPVESQPLCGLENAPRFDLNAVEAGVRSIMAWYGHASGNINWQDRVCLLDETGVYVGLLQLLQYGCGFLVICLTSVVLFLLLLAHVPFLATRQQRRGMRLGAVGVTTMWLLMLLVLWPENVLTATVLNLYLTNKHLVPLSTLWSAGIWTREAIPIANLDVVREYMPLIWFDIFFMILLAGVTLLAWWLLYRHRKWAGAHTGEAGEALLGRLKPPFTAHADWGPRLLLSKSYEAAILLFMLVISGTALAHYFKILEWLDAHVWWLKGIGTLPHELFMPLATMTIIVVVGMVLFLVAAHAIQRAVKLSLDVVNHFAAPNKQFPIRTRIADRLADTLDFLLSQKDKPHLVIVCHSQGTVVTLDTLLGYQKHVYEGRWPLRSRKQVWQPGLWETRLQNEVASLTILTFGSPITHLYQHYFPSLYPKLGSMPALQGLEAEIAAGRVRWFNSYRVDDYIGTWIDPARENFPVNVPMPVGGHTSYWRQDVFERLFAEPGMEDVLVDTSGRA